MDGTLPLSNWLTTTAIPSLRNALSHCFFKEFIENTKKFNIVL